MTYLTVISNELSKKKVCNVVFVSVCVRLCQDIVAHTYGLPDPDLQRFELHFRLIDNDRHVFQSGCGYENERRFMTIVFPLWSKRVYLCGLDDDRC